MIEGFQYDECDAPLVKAHLWVKIKGRSTFYVARHVRADGQVFRIYFHREATGVSPELQVDHRDGDGLNNCRQNLRFATNSQNHAGKMTRPAHFKSRFRGVYFQKQNRNWCAQIKQNYRKKHIGSFAREEDAACAYDRVALEKFGEFAQLNFPLDSNLNPCIVSP